MKATIVLLIILAIGAAFMVGYVSGELQIHYLLGIIK